jgi:flagellar protein FliS
MKNPALAYRQFSVQSATPLGLVVMLYDGAIAAMQTAAAATEANDIAKKCTHLNRALAIIAQLEGTLNFELGGEVAQTLKSLYLYARTQLLKAHIENSPQRLQALIDKIATVREAWYEADHRPSVPPTAPVGTNPSGETPQVAQPGQTSYPARRAAEGYPYAPSPATEPGSWRVLA